jgi:hypothetical protein
MPLLGLRFVFHVGTCESGPLPRCVTAASALMLSFNRFSLFQILTA